MVQTNIEYFNSTLKLFIKEISSIYTDYNDLLNEYYKDLLENDSSNDDKHIKRFMRKMSDNKIKISNKDDTLFNDNIFILKNVDFKEIWENTLTTPRNKESIWNYLQTLFVIGETIISDSDKIKNLVDNFKKVRDNESGEDLDADNKEVFDMLKNLSENSNKNPINEDLINNGLIGNLAKELAEEINIDDMNLNINEDSENVGDVFSNLMSGDNPMKFMNLIQNVGQKIQNKLENGNIDQGDLVNEAQNMMGLLGNNNPLFNDLLKNAKNEMKDANPPNNPSYNNPTRDRLRKKLEQKQKNKK